jgi:hypothetical protein
MSGHASARPFSIQRIHLLYLNSYVVIGLAARSLPRIGHEIIKLPLKGGDDSCTSPGSSTLIYAYVDLLTMTLVVEGLSSSLFVDTWYTYVVAFCEEVVFTPFSSYIVKLVVRPDPTFLL